MDEKSFKDFSPSYDLHDIEKDSIKEIVDYVKSNLNGNINSRFRTHYPIIKTDCLRQNLHGLKKRNETREIDHIIELNWVTSILQDAVAGNDCEISMYDLVAILTYFNIVLNNSSNFKYLDKSIHVIKTSLCKDFTLVGQLKNKYPDIFESIVVHLGFTYLVYESELFDKITVVLGSKWKNQDYTDVKYVKKKFVKLIIDICNQTIVKIFEK